MEDIYYKHILIHQITEDLNYDILKKLKKYFKLSSLFTNCDDTKIMLSNSVRWTKRFHNQPLNSNIVKNAKLFNPDTDMMLGYYLEQYVSLNDLEKFILETLL